MTDFLLESALLENPPETDNAGVSPLSPVSDIPKATENIQPIGPRRKTTDFIADSLTLDEQVEDERVTQSLDIALQEPTERGVKLDRISRALGVPLFVVEQNPEEAEKILKIQQTKKTLETAPVLKRKMTEPSFARAVQDEVDGLSFWETVLRDADVGLERGKATRALGILGARLRAGEDVEQRIKELEEQIPELRGTKGFIEAAANAIGTFIEGVPEVLAKGGAGAVGAGSAAAIGGPVSTAVGGGAGFVAGAGSEVFRQSALVEGGLIFNDLVKDGVDPEIAGPVSQVAGMINGALEVVSAGIIAAPIKRGVTRLVRKLLKEKLHKATLAQATKNLATSLGSVVAKETVTEVLQEVTSVGAGEVGRAIDPNGPPSKFSTPEGTQEVIDQFGEVITETLKAMTVLGAPGASVNFVADVKASKRADENKAVMEAIGENAKESEVLKSTPELFQEYVKEATKDAPVKDIYIDAREFQSYFQSQGLDPAEVVQELPQTREQYEAAVTAGHDLRIPLDEYATRIAPTEHHSALLRHARFDPSQDMTLAEAEEFKSNNQEKFAEEADKALDDAIKSDEFEVSSNKVFEDIKTQLVSTGRVTEDAANQNAELFRSFAKSQAKRLGIQPEEVFDRLGLKIQGEPIVGEDVLNQTAKKVTKTPEFKKFFKGSKVVDGEGQPLVVFHGTGADFLEFDTEDFGAWFAVNPDEAANFGDVVRSGEGSSQNIRPVFLSIKNPLRVPSTIDLDKFHSVDEIFKEINKENGTSLTPEKAGLDLTREEPAKAFEIVSFEDDFIQAVKDAGFDGMTAFEGGELIYNAFSPTQIKSIFNRGTFDPNDPRILFQQDKDNPRAFIQFIEDLDLGDQAVISLLENSDLTSFLHETGHFFFETIRLAANQENAPAEIVKDMEALLDFVGVANIETWNGMTFEERRAGHEQIADAFENYLFEGKAPSQGLREAFRRFRTWLIQVYKSLPGRVQLTDEVRGVFDRMLATEEEINETKRKLNFQPIFESAEEAGMSDSEWAEYRVLVADDDALAQEELGTRSLRNMEWLTRAKSRVLRQLQRENRDKRKGVESAVSEEIASTPVYLAKRWLRGPVEKKKTVKSNPDKVDPANDSLFSAIAKLGGLNKEEVVRLWGVDPADKFNSGVFGKPVLRVNGGIPVDQMAEKLAVEGYILPDANGKAEVTDLEDKFFIEHSGNKQFSTQNEEFSIADDLENFITEQEGQTIETDITRHGKLNRGILSNLYGNSDDAVWKQLPKGRFGMVADEGFHPDLIAETFGFSSGDEMIQALVASPPLKEAIEAETDSRMLELFGDLNDPETLNTAVNEAVHNQARTKMVHAELRALSKKVGSGNVLRSAAKDFARTRIALIKVRDLKPNQYIAAERRSARNALDAMGKGKLDEAADHKRAEVLNHHFAKEALKAKEDVDKAVRFFKKFDRIGTRQNLDPDYLDQIDKLLERYEFRKVTLKEIDRRKSLAEWIKTQEALGLSPVIDEKLLKDIQQRNFKDVPVEELMGLKDAVKSIEHLGRLKNKLLLAKRQRELEAAAQEGIASINKFSKGRKKIPLEPRTKGESIKRGISSFFASNRKMSSFLRTMDGHKDGGVMWELFMLPLNERSDFEASEREKATERLIKLFSVYDRREKFSVKEFIPAINDSLSKEARLVLAMNSGNETNRIRIRDGYGWDDAQIDSILDTLEKKDWDFVRSIWGFINEYWPEIEAKEKRVSGVAPEKVEGSPVQTRFGEIEGAYYPIKYENLADTTAQGHLDAEAAKQLLDGGYTRATTRRGHTKERVDVVKRKIRLDFGVLTEHVNQVIHDLAFHEYLIDSSRLLKHEELSTAIIENYGRPVYEEMQKLQEDVAKGDVPATNQFESLSAYLRNGASVAAMGWNVNTALLQPLGIFQSMQLIDTKWVAKGMSRWFGGGDSMNQTVQWIHESSEFMRLRAKTINREVNELRNTIDRDNKIMPKPVRDSYFVLISKMQMLVDIPTWLGQYEKSMAAGETEERAFALADQAVIDSQGAGQIKDLARIQRGSQFQRLFTNFMSYFQVTFQRTMESAHEHGVTPSQFTKTLLNNPANFSRFAVDVMLLYTFPILLTFYLKEAFFNGECDSGTDLACVAKKTGMDHLGYAVGGIIGARELGSAINGFAGYQGPAGTRFYSELTNFITQVGQGELDKPLVRSGAQAVGIATHFPANQVYKTMDGFIALSEGKTDNPVAPFLGVPRDDK